MCLLLPDVREVFDLFDFWDAKDGYVDGCKVGDMLRCMGFNPTNKLILANGGTKKLGRSLYLLAWQTVQRQGVRITTFHSRHRQTRFLFYVIIYFTLLFLPLCLMNTRRCRTC